MKTCFNKIISVILVLIMLVSAVPFTASAFTISSGTCGDNLTWSIECTDWADYSSYTLIISGTGPMNDFVSVDLGSSGWSSDAPWSSSWFSSVFVEKGVTSVGDYAFYRNGVKSVSLPSTITSIGDSAFYSCIYLESINIPESVTKIGVYAFGGCESLNSINVPGNVSDIGFAPFVGSGIETVVFESGISTIYEALFCFCESIKSITIPKSVVSVDGNFSFSNFPNLTEVYYEGTEEQWNKISFNSTKDNALYMAEIHFLNLPDEVLVDVTQLSKDGTTITVAIDLTSGTFNSIDLAFEMSGLVCKSIEKGDFDENSEALFFSNTASNATNNIAIASFDGVTPGNLAVVTLEVIDDTYSFNVKATACDVIGDETVAMEPIITSSVSGFEHRYSAVVTNPTCEDEGFTTYTCPCGDSYVDDYVGSLGHDMSDWEETTPATCTDAGEETRGCSRCEYTEKREIPVIDHSHKAVVTAPTCTEQGFTTYTCSCGDSYVDDYVGSLGHDMGDWEETTPATCTDAGEETRGCSQCKYTETREIPVSGHIYKDVVTPPTCEDEGYTTHTCHCSYKYIDSFVDPLGHDLGDWEEIIPATCTDAGEETRGCSRCEYTETRDIPVSPHSHKAVVTAPTCTEQGFTTYTCSCGDSYVDDYVGSLGHDMSDWEETAPATCTEVGKETRGCSRCEYTEKRDIPVIDHSHKAVVTAPTCTDQGFTTYSCPCGDTYVDDYVGSLGHDMGDWEETAPATCTEAGEETRGCSRCEYTEKRDIPVIDHSHKAVVTAPTCTDQGFTTYTCHCGDSYVGDYVGSLGHDMGDWEETTPATCTDAGEETRGCSQCKYTETREIPVIPHSHKAVVTPPTCTEQGYTTYTCHCGDSYVDDYVSSKGHAPGEWEVTAPATSLANGTKVLKCSVCSTVLDTQSIPKLGSVNSVSIDNLSMQYKTSATFAPVIVADNGVEYSVTYSSSDPSVASVDENGNVNALGKGSAEITCTVTDEYGNVASDTATVEVKYVWWQWIIVILLFGWIWY